MQKQKFSWNRLFIFNQAAVHYIKGIGKETRFTFALNRVMRQIHQLNQYNQERLEQIAIDNCVTGKQGEAVDVILKDEIGNLLFTKDGAKRRDKEQREYLEKDEHEVEPYFVSIVPETLSVDELYAFAGLVFPDDQLDELLAMKEETLDDDATSAEETNDTAQTADA
jgi:hypothetical protein